jgi:hypothetical protein
VRLLIDRIQAAPKQVYFGAALSALVVGIGANALLLQIGRRPPPLFVPAAQDAPPMPTGAAPTNAIEAAALHASPAPPSPDNAAAIVGAARSLPAPAPDTTSSIGKAAQDKQSPRSLSAAVGADHSERGAVARAPDQIGDLLRGKPIDDGSHLVRTAQIALAKLGYPVKANGAEDGATRRALRDFERAHGLALTTELNPDLVKQLNAATKADR